MQTFSQFNTWKPDNKECQAKQKKWSQRKEHTRPHLEHALCSEERDMNSGVRRPKAKLQP